MPCNHDDRDVDTANSVTEGSDKMHLKKINTFLQCSLSLKDVLHFQKTSDSSTESDILARLGFYKQTAQIKYVLLL